MCSFNQNFVIYSGAHKINTFHALEIEGMRTTFGEKLLALGSLSTTKGDRHFNSSRGCRLYYSELETLFFKYKTERSVYIFHSLFLMITILKYKWQEWGSCKSLSTFSVREKPSTTENPTTFARALTNCFNRNVRTGNGTYDYPKNSSVTNACIDLGFVTHTFQM